jgi:hypothetical protein
MLEDVILAPADIGGLEMLPISSGTVFDMGSIAPGRKVEYR